MADLFQDSVRHHDFHFSSRAAPSSAGLTWNCGYDDFWKLPLPRIMVIGILRSCVRSCQHMPHNLIRRGKRGRTAFSDFHTPPVATP